MDSNFRDNVCDPINPAIEMSEYIQRQIIRRAGVEITPETPLVSSGLIDSFALVEIFLKLEKLTRRKIPASKVQAKDMDTVQLMLATAERIGKPRE
jgi:acyl carrier protein